MPIPWTPWQPLRLDYRPSPRVLAELLDGGQAFRWNYDAKAQHFEGIWSKHRARLRLAPNQQLEASFPQRSATTPSDLQSYLGSDTDWKALTDSLPWRSDPHLKACIDSFPHLRLLQQAFPETLLAFLCSATKQIPQIKVMCSNLAQALGSPIDPETQALPTWEQLSAASETQLRALALGFRAKNIKKTADLLAADPQLLQEIEAAPYPQAKAALMELPGVGEKIADCALLFGAGKLEAFPVDTWIIKVLERRYGLSDWSNAQLAQFGRLHFGPAAGYAQQYLFAQERHLRSVTK